MDAFAVLPGEVNKHVYTLFCELRSCVDLYQFVTFSSSHNYVET